MAPSPKASASTESSPAIPSTPDTYVAKLVWLRHSMTTVGYTTWAERQAVSGICKVLSDEAIHAAETAASSEVDLVAIPGRPAISVRGPLRDVQAVLKAPGFAKLVDRVSDEPLAVAASRA